MAPTLTSSEQAQLETHLAAAHKAIWKCLHLYLARDDYDAADEFQQLQEMLYERLEVELKKGRRLRTR